MFGIFGFIRRNYLYSLLTHQLHKKTAKPLKFGILGAAAIAPNALILPARSHPEVEGLLPFAARSKTRAEEYAKKHGIPKTFGSYQELLDCPDIDVVYNPLPNALHYEWAIKTLLAGKHLLLEKPSTDTAEETRKIFELAEKKGLRRPRSVPLSVFHPAVQKAKSIIQTGELGQVQSVSTSLCLSGIFDSKAQTDIRFKHDLGGGAMMDVGCYTLSALRYFGGNPTSVDGVTFTTLGSEGNVDRSASASFTLPNNVAGSIKCDLDQAKTLGFIPTFDFKVIVKCTKGSLTPDGMHSRTEKAYTFDDDSEKKGEFWWSTYRYQLESFMDRLKGRTPKTWVEKEDSIENMVWIEKVYEKMGIGSRPASTYRTPE
ncbi:NAD(P)-binding protein [Flagelloscypha sp. PMI_526]|nr:NAD(P)-binding protein [Flagelloscypha sp. PMI_526]